MDKWIKSPEEVRKEKRKLLENKINRVKNI